MIKKILKILGVIVILLIAAIIVLPIVFKDDIIEKVKEEINNNVNAKVDFGDFDLSLISSFPDFTFSIEKISVIGVGEFEGVTLASIGEINLVVDLMSVINGENFKIKVIEILSPEMNVIVTKDGVANYDIAKASEGEVEEEVEVEEVEVEDTTAGAAFKLELQKFEIASANITYDDRQGNMYAGLKDFNFLLKGDFSADITDILADMSIAAITYKMDGVSFLNKAEIEMHAELGADLANSKYTFTENSFRINQLVLGFDGWLQLLENDAMDMDVTFNTKQTTFKSILSLVPAVYTRDFESVQTNGQLALSGFAKGKMEGESYPAFGLDLSVKDANFKYPDLPKSVENIQLAVNVQSPGGDLDKMQINVATFHIELAGNPFDMSVLVKTPMSDPFIKAKFTGDLDLSSIKDVIPLESGDEINGLIAMDISLEGNQSTIDEERYEDFEAQGNLIITSMMYSSTTLPYKVNIEKIDVNFAPKYITLKEMKMKVGRSDFSASGQVEKFIPFVFDDEAVLYARLDLRSNLIDATEFMEEETPAATGEEGIPNTEVSTEPAVEEAMEVVEIPGNIDFALNSSIGKIHLEDFDIDNFKGMVTMKDKKMALENTSMNLLNGKLTTSGSYETFSPKRPTFDFALKVEKFDVKTTVNTFNTVEKLVPLLKKSEGSYSTNFSIQGVFDEKMEIIGESLYGKGILMTHEMGLKDFAPLELAADKLKREDLRNPRLDNMNISFTIEGGKMIMDPFEIKTGSIVTTLSGWTAFDQTMEYDMDMAIPRKDFGGAANKAASELLSALQAKTGQTIELPEIVHIKGKITGTADDPKIALELPSFGGGSAKDDLKKKLEEELAKKKKELEEQARKEAERLKKEAEDRARAEADKLKKDAEAKAKAEADKLKKQAEDEARKKVEAEKRKKEEEAKKKLDEEAKKKLKNFIK